MRELWKTGYMHNRVCMIVASFLIKDLLIDWQKGKEWFEETLLDADLASNSANWQWIAGSGADTSPYFRIFNPLLQGEKFDKEAVYIKRWVPELTRLDPKKIHKLDFQLNNYPAPMVEHSAARKEALLRYKKIKSLSS